MTLCPDVHHSKADRRFRVQQGEAFRYHTWHWQPNKHCNAYRPDANTTIKIKQRHGTPYNSMMTNRWVASGPMSSWRQNNILTKWCWLTQCQVLLHLLSRCDKTFHVHKWWASEYHITQCWQRDRVRAMPIILTPTQDSEKCFWETPLISKMKTGNTFWAPLVQINITHFICVLQWKQKFIWVSAKSAVTFKAKIKVVQVKNYAHTSPLNSFLYIS
jgi:hypothetical protein